MKRYTDMRSELLKFTLFRRLKKQKEVC